MWMQPWVVSEAFTPHLCRLWILADQRTKRAHAWPTGNDHSSTPRKMLRNSLLEVLVYITPWHRLVRLSSLYCLWRRLDVYVVNVTSISRANISSSVFLWSRDSPASYIQSYLQDSPFFLSSRCALWSRIKALQQQLSICCPCERGESFSLRWILGWQSHMQANAHTHTHALTHGYTLAEGTQAHRRVNTSASARARRSLWT